VSLYLQNNLNFFLKIRVLKGQALSSKIIYFVLSYFCFNFSEFQKKVLHLLVEIRNSLKDIKGSGHEQTEFGDFNVKKCDDLDDFKQLEDRIKSPEERRRLVRVLMNRKKHFVLHHEHV
jgi:competence protein ComGF